MKTKTLLKLIAGISLLFTAGICGAQTSVTLTAAGDSSWAANCPTPANVGFYAYGNTQGYVPNDSMTIRYFFGDGTSSTQKTPIYTNTVSGSGSYYGWVGHIYTTPGLYTFMAIATAPDGKADTVIQTSGVPVTDTCGNIKGKVYIDLNTNCVYDAGVDSIVRGYPVNLSQGANIIRWAWTDANGDYVFSAPTSIVYSVNLGNPGTSGYTFACPLSGSVSFTATSNSVNDLGLGCTTSGFDLKTTISSAGFRPRLNGWVYVTASNMSCNSVNATLSVTLDVKTQYVSANPAPSSVTGNVVTWNLPGLSHSFSQWNINNFYATITVLTDSMAQIGDTLCFTSNITPTVGDLNVSNNTAFDCSPVRNSYDPNMKEVSPVGMGANGDVAPNTDFTYTVHFQNTGNDVAYNVAILDTLDNNLDVTTLDIIAASHNVHTRMFGNNVIKFNFDNIMLPDSGSNMQGSMGYVMYKIKAKSGLANGAQIRNTAHIFFDYNEAIITNTTLNTISISLGIENANVQTTTYHVYPNPVNDILNLNFDQTFSGQISLIDMLGKEVMVKAIENQMNTTINTSVLEKGVYFIRVNDQMSTTQKIIVVH